ncbi:MAG: nucleotidyltransferase family protein [Acidobacteria bacterium]|nr:nucleotidyltransferase family protein [Acidobacteriota bacterium]
MTENSNGKIGGLILAAGGSSRLGRPKQLVHFQGKTLIRNAAETLVDSSCDSIVVVLGAEIDGSTSEIADLPINICINHNWQTGMSSSIKAGLKELVKLEGNLSAVVVTLCDQPHITTENIDQLVTEFQQANPRIVAAQYGETVGVPALFSKELFNDLLKLKGDKGARQLIRDNLPFVERIEIEKAAIDIDHPDDADRLLPD